MMSLRHEAEPLLTESILGYPVTVVTKEDCISQIMRWVGNGEKGRYVVCANPHSLEVAKGDPDFQEALMNADIVIPDGIGMVLASRILGGNIHKRITGSDIFMSLNTAMNRRKGFGVFFLGSTENTLKKIEDKMKGDFQNVAIKGTYSPPFKTEFSTEDDRAMVAAVNRARPDVLWVGMTAPKQEKWIRRNRDKLDVKFIGAIGAVFDFYTGKVKRSHPVFQKMGLEWLPRLVREPLRLWRRNFISNPMFLFRVIMSRRR